MARTLLAAAIAAPWVIWAVVRGTGLELPYPVAPALAFTPYVALTAFVPVVAAALLRRWQVAVVALVAGVALVGYVLPRGVQFSDPAAVGSGNGLTVMSVNVLVGTADPATVMRIAREHDVDVLSLQESRPDWLARLDADGAAARFPHRSAAPIDVALLSRRPLRPTGQPAEGDLTIGSTTVRVTAVHPLPPVSTERWRDWHDELNALPGTGGATRRILAGDFNATLDHPELRGVLGRGYQDAADAVGDGWRTTWPAGRRFPPEITIDHVLADKRIGVAAYSVRKVPGSDHRAIVARLVVEP